MGRPATPIEEIKPDIFAVGIGEHGIHLIGKMKDRNIIGLNYLDLPIHYSMQDIGVLVQTLAHAWIAIIVVDITERGTHEALALLSGELKALKQLQTLLLYTELSKPSSRGTVRDEPPLLKSQADLIFLFPYEINGERTGTVGDLDLLDKASASDMLVYAVEDLLSSQYGENRAGVDLADFFSLPATDDGIVVTGLGATVEAAFEATIRHSYLADINREDVRGIFYILCGGDEMTIRDLWQLHE